MLLRRRSLEAASDARNGEDLVLGKGAQRQSELLQGDELDEGGLNIFKNEGHGT